MDRATFGISGTQPDERYRSLRPAAAARRGTGAAAALARRHRASTVERCTASSAAYADARQRRVEPRRRVSGLRVPPTPVLQPRQTRLRLARARGRAVHRTTRVSSTSRDPAATACSCRSRSAANAGRSTSRCAAARSDDGRTARAARDLRPAHERRRAQRVTCTSRPTNPWPTDAAGTARNRVPDDWLEPDGARVKRETPARACRSTSRSARDGHLDGGDLSAASSRRRSGSACVAASRYGGRQTADFGKLATSAPAGGSTRDDDPRPAAIRELRCRGDARARGPQAASASPTTARTPRCRPATSTTSSRSACSGRRCTEAVRLRGTEDCAHDELAQAVFDALALPIELYADDPDVKGRREARDRRGAARRARLPPLSRSPARLADHLAEPGAERPAARSTTTTSTNCVADEEVWGRSYRAGSGEDRDSTRPWRRPAPTTASWSRGRCSTSCAASSRSRSTTSTQTRQEALKQRSEPAADRPVGDRRERGARRTAASLYPRSRAGPTISAATSTSRHAAASGSYLAPTRDVPATP